MNTLKIKQNCKGLVMNKYQKDSRREDMYLVDYLNTSKRAQIQNGLLFISAVTIIIFLILLLICRNNLNVFNVSATLLTCAYLIVFISYVYGVLLKHSLRQNSELYECLLWIFNEIRSSGRFGYL